MGYIVLNNINPVGKSCNSVLGQLIYIGVVLHANKCMEEQKKGLVDSEKQFVDSENIDFIDVFELFRTKRKDVLYQKKIKSAQKIFDIFGSFKI